MNPTKAKSKLIIAAENQAFEHAGFLIGSLVSLYLLIHGVIS